MKHQGESVASPRSLSSARIRATRWHRQQQIDLSPPERGKPDARTDRFQSELILL